MTLPTGPASRRIMKLPGVVSELACNLLAMASVCYAEEIAYEKV